MPMMTSNPSVVTITNAGLAAARNTISISSKSGLWIVGQHLVDRRRDPVDVAGSVGHQQTVALFRVKRHGGEDKPFYRSKESCQIGLSPTGGGGFALVFGLGRSPFGGSAGNSPTWRSCVALLVIARRRRFNRLAICEGEFVGHSATSARSSSSVQRDMVGYLGHGCPKPAAMSSDSCGTILAIAF
jgi:hypothetical protein